MSWINHIASCHTFIVATKHADSLQMPNWQSLLYSAQCLRLCTVFFLSHLQKLFNFLNTNSLPLMLSMFMWKISVPSAAYCSFKKAPSLNYCYCTLHYVPRSVVHEAFRQRIKLQRPQCFPEKKSAGYRIGRHPLNTKTGFKIRQRNHKWPNPFIHSKKNG